MPESPAPMITTSKCSALIRVLRFAPAGQGPPQATFAKGYTRRKGSRPAYLAHAVPSWALMLQFVTFPSEPRADSVSAASIRLIQGLAAVCALFVGDIDECRS